MFKLTLICLVAAVVEAAQMLLIKKDSGGDHPDDPQRHRKVLCP